jgi:hypothetical protein
MCSSQRPLNGADSIPIHALDDAVAEGPQDGCSACHAFLVDLRGLYDTDDRLTVRVTADDEREARAIAKRMHPDYFATTARAA